MKLYYSPGACSLSPHIVLREAGYDFDLEKVDLKEKKTNGGGDYTAVNPKGYVPALQLDDGQILTEGPAIVQYLADQKPDAKLAPPTGTLERVRLQEWLNFITSELHKGFSPLFNPAVPEAFKTMAKEKLASRFDWLDQHLAKNQYLMGSQFSVADPYAFVVVGWSKHLGIDLKPFPNLRGYLDRVGSRPSVQAALRAEELAP